MQPAVDLHQVIDHADAVGDNVVGEHVAHVLDGVSGTPHVDVDVEAHALEAVALVRIGADPHRQDKVAHENAVAGRPHLMVIRALGVGVGRRRRRDQITHHAEGGGIERRHRVAAGVEHAAEAEDVGRERQEPGNVGRFEGSGKTRHERIRPARADEGGERRDVHAIDETCASVSSVEHGAGETGRAQTCQQRGEGVRVGLAVGEQHGDDPGVSCMRRKARDARVPLRVREQADPDVLHAGGRQGGRGRGERLRFHRQIARRGARRPAPGNRADRRARRVRIGGAVRIREVDDVRAEPDRGLGVARAHAREQQGHGRHLVTAGQLAQAHRGCGPRSGETIKSA